MIAEGRRVVRAGQMAWLFGLLAAVTAGCGREAPQSAAVESLVRPDDAQHQGITTPHGDHSPHHSGIVLMNGELHYEVVLDPSGVHRVWFTDAVREDLPASIARDVTMVVSRPDAPPETLAMDIDEAGESWIVRGKPIAGDGVMVKLSYTVQGTPHEVEIPFVAR